TNARSVIDDTGTRVTVVAPARRIVTLAPNLAALAASAGAGDRIVGVSSYSDAAAAAGRPIVSSPGRVDLEQLIALRPDLVLAWGSGNPPRALARLAARGVPVYVTEPRTLEDLARTVRAIGRLAGTDSTAESAARQFEEEVAAITASRAALERRNTRVFIEISADPMMTVSGAHLIADLVKRCGGTNVFAASAFLTARIGTEDLVRAAPDLILTSAVLSPPDVARAWASRRRTVAAVRDGRVLRLDSMSLHRQDLQVTEALRSICDGLRRPRRTVTDHKREPLPIIRG
ncbi:MAG: helical backbone metal receptor, partial [Burkholderiales bacterium]